MSDMEQTKPGEPAYPIDDYDRQHGAPREEDVNAYPPVATPDTEPKPFRVK